MGKTLIIVGLVITAIGLLLQFAKKIPWLGKLPGDIYIEKEHYTLYFPITTSILVSLLLFVIMYLIGKIR